MLTNVTGDGTFVGDHLPDDIPDSFIAIVVFFVIIFTKLIVIPKSSAKVQIIVSEANSPVLFSAIWYIWKTTNPEYLTQFLRESSPGRRGLCGSLRFEAWQRYDMDTVFSRISILSAGQNHLESRLLYRHLTFGLIMFHYQLMQLD